MALLGLILSDSYSLSKPWLSKAGRMAQQVKGPATKHRNLSSVPGIYDGRGANSYMLTSDLCTPVTAWLCFVFKHKPEQASKQHSSICLPQFLF